jgi:rhodanese-related sulfurtransferase
MERLPEFVARHWALFATLAALVVLAIVNELRRVRGFSHALGVGEAVEFINRRHAVLLDVRDEAEYRAGRLHDALHIPLAALDQRLKELERHKQRPIIAYCRSGDRSGRAAAALRNQGFDAHNLSGGLLAWQNANLPVVKG